jgi:penicillin-binding protein 1A
MSAIRDRSRRIRQWLGARPRFVRAAVFTILAGISLVGGLGIGTWQSVCHDCPSVAQIYVWEPKQSTKIFDHDGKLIAELFEERRTPIEISTLPAHVPQAFVAVEDKRFYEHRGVDPRGIARALITRRGGGSTITQQLARNIFTERIGFERRLSHGGLTRKLKEARVAQQIEQVYSKEQILQAYINQVNYGHGWRGIETAAQHYFGKPAIDLNPAEAAMLAAAVNRPGQYSPFIDPVATLRRRNTVLGLMENEGFISEQDEQRWKTEPLPTTRHGTEVGRIAPYFVEWIRTILDNRYGEALYNKGLRVYTSLDLEMQRAAQAAMDSGWARIENTPGYRHPKYATVIADENRAGTTESPYIQGLFVALDPATGGVRALVGGRDFNDSKFNRATQALRQPGSTFKPFVYYTALNSGVPASHVLYDAPLMIDLPDGTVYSPKNYDPDFRGPLTMRDAL